MSDQEDLEDESGEESYRVNEDDDQTSDHELS